jgi:hypothetical protein
MPGQDSDNLLPPQLGQLKRYLTGLPTPSPWESAMLEELREMERLLANTQRGGSTRRFRGVFVMGPPPGNCSICGRHV